MDLQYAVDGAVPEIDWDDRVLASGLDLSYLVDAIMFEITNKNHYEID